MENRRVEIVRCNTCGRTDSLVWVYRSGRWSSVCKYHLRKGEPYLVYFKQSDGKEYLDKFVAYHPDGSNTECFTLERAIKIVFSFLNLIN